MIDNPLSWFYFPTAFALGALHALEPGHAKTLTAAYLIGIKGTKRDAFLLGVSVAFTHSIVVIGIAVSALWVGREAFTQDITHWLELSSGVVVIIIGSWLFAKRWRAKKYGHDHDHDHDHHHGHHHEIPDYAGRGERPTLLQIITFGAAGGMIPCPASVTVMLLAFSIGKIGAGLIALVGFSLGLAVTLVSVGLAIVLGLRRLTESHKFNWFSENASLISAAMVILSGVFALLFVK